MSSSVHRAIISKREAQAIYVPIERIFFGYEDGEALWVPEVVPQRRGAVGSATPDVRTFFPTTRSLLLVTLACLQVVLMQKLESGKVAFHHQQSVNFFCTYYLHSTQKSCIACKDQAK